MADKKEILNQIVSVLEEPFSVHGFRYVKRGCFERVTSNGNTRQQYNISLVGKYGCLSAHLVMSVENKVLLKDYDNLYKETLIFTYRNFEEDWRNKCIKSLQKK